VIGGYTSPDRKIILGVFFQNGQQGPVKGTGKVSFHKTTHLSNKTGSVNIKTMPCERAFWVEIAMTLARPERKKGGGPKSKKGRK